MRSSIFFAALFCPFETFAEEDDHRAQGWVLAMAQSRVGEKGWVYLELQPRATFDGGGVTVDPVIVRAAVGWQLPLSVSAWIGAATVNREQRVFQQLLWADTFGPVKLIARFRFEERWLPGVDEVRLRARLQLRVQWTFWGPLLLIAYDEPFVNVPQGFDQNRAYLALGWRPLPKVLVELGYLNQSLPTRMGHTAVFSAGLGF